MTNDTATSIRFTANTRKLGESLIAQLPEDASSELPSRGQVAVTGTIGGEPWEAVLEPDGRKGHWFRVDEVLQRAHGVDEGTALDIEIAPSAQWPEPVVPDDLKGALDDAHDIHDLWVSITPMARWEWVRWVRATRNAATRARRVEVAIDKMRNGKRRPCCFDLASCTDPELARSGKLAEKL